MRNPFKPTAGARPPQVIGRANVLDSFIESIGDGSGAPGLLTIFTGPRGIGKTVMLSEAEDAARELGWAVISETATRGMLSRIAESVQELLEEHGTDGPSRARLRSLTLGPVSVGLELPPAQQVTLRRMAELLLEIFERNGTGLVLSIDEVHGVDRTELGELAALVQHLIRQDLPVGMLMAGLPGAVSTLLNEGVSTFMRRAERVDLHDASISEVRTALESTFSGTGVAAAPEHLDRMAAATGGYPFLIQLVGYHVWRLAVRSGATTDDVVTQGLDTARKRLGSTVLASAFTGLSDVDRTFLLKMAADDGPSRVGDIAARMGESIQYTGVYRRRLIDAGIIGPVRHGEVDFTVPYLRDYLREHAAMIAAINTPPMA